MNPSYHRYLIDSTHLQLSSDPLDDYQRYLFLEVYELLKPTITQFPHALESQLSISRKEYKTNTVFGLDYEEETKHDNKDNGAARGEVAKSKLKRSSVLDCNEYVIPDITRNTVTQNTFDPSFQPYLQLTPYNILALEDDGEEEYDNGDGLRRCVDNGTFGAKTNSNITKNQEFKMIKLNAKISQTMIINPNNCIIWDCDTGYVFFTGIWRLYQDIMKCLCTTNRQYQQDQSSRNHCCQELQKVLYQVIYGKLDKPTKKDSEPKWNKWFRKDSFSTYIDLHWHKLDPQLSAALEQTYGSGIAFEHILKRIRGGYIKIQGTWLPFPVAKELCSRFCYPMRHLLVPLFGPDFPKKCEYWYLQRCNTSPTVSSSLSPTSGNSISTLTSDEQNSLNTAQDLLNISRRSSWNEVRHPSIVSQLKVSPRHYRSQSWTGIVQQNATLEERRKSSDVTLPPIQYLFNDLRNSYLDDPRK